VFSDFELWYHSLPTGVILHGRSGGAGTPLVLLHGHPRTHTTWHAVAPLLSRAGFRVVCPDLRGYGHSSAPHADAAHEAYSDRAMARDVVALMEALGHRRFAVVGHDRGSYVAYRTALDHPDRVTALGVLDGVPIVEALERADSRFAEDWWHWFFLGASPEAERVITADPLGWYRPDRTTMGAENYADFVDAVSDPSTVRAMLEDYRAGLHVDRGHDEEDRRLGRRIGCPTLVGWSRWDDMPRLYGDPTEIWRSWCAGHVESAVLDSGHHMAEEVPAQVAWVLTRFLNGIYSQEERSHAVGT
jgi:haloacetate dehalogenase